LRKKDAPGDNIIGFNMLHKKTYSLFNENVSISKEALPAIEKIARALSSDKQELREAFAAAADYRHPEYFKNKTFLSAFFETPHKFIKTQFRSKTENAEVYRHTTAILRALRALKPMRDCSGGKKLALITTYILNEETRGKKGGREFFVKTMQHTINFVTRKCCDDSSCSCRNKNGVFVKDKDILQYNLRGIDLMPDRFYRKLNDKIYLVKYNFNDYFWFNKKEHMIITEDLLKVFLKEMLVDFGFPKNKKGQPGFDQKLFKAHILQQLSEKHHGERAIPPTPVLAPATPAQGLLFH
jgi:hypothetical protein